MGKGGQNMEKNQAEQLMTQGYVWAEAVLLAVCQKFELKVDDNVIPQIAFGFAGGIGQTGSVCGAVAGAVMAISLKMEKGNTMKQGLRALGTVQEFRRRFEAEMETVYCRELTGVDMTTEEGIQQYMSSDKPQTVCFPAVGLAYRLVVDLLHDTS